jgi:hypothetical protein
MPTASPNVELHTVDSVSVAITKDGCFCSGSKQLGPDLSFGAIEKMDSDHKQEHPKAAGDTGSNCVSTHVTLLQTSAGDTPAHA